VRETTEWNSVSETENTLKRVEVVSGQELVRFSVLSVSAWDL